MAKDRRLRTLEDLLRVVRALAYEFNTDTVFVVGSQAILASMPDAPEPARASPEIDALRRRRDDRQAAARLAGPPDRKSRGGPYTA
ncbi:hypothetical protein [Bradyrhizobium vignae]|uniref:Uncharacterized protein n=1 Tax=Bradyrhizobium vignae TaxID=1549949 RepID=A0A2U3PUL4_9BRAD|nr:hypothetical protein [Bradyrhizobium vignae]SPP92850.1 protein of unknown function [Bradyrhizobium vignae]